MDLLNTLWVESGQQFDLLDMADGLQTWLAGQPAIDPAAGCIGLQLKNAARRRLFEACRETLRTVVKATARRTRERGGPGAVERAAGARCLVRRLGPAGPELTPEVDDPADLIAWLAADDYLRLLEQVPTRIRGACAHPDCVLHFYRHPQPQGQPPLVLDGRLR